MPVSEDEPKLLEIQQQAIDWLVLSRADNPNEAEMIAFADWLSSDQRHLQAYVAAENLFQDMKCAAVSRTAEMAEIDTVATEPATLSTVAIPTPSARRRRWVAVSLALAASWLLALILLMPQQSYRLMALFSDYHTGTGEFREVELNDGSRMLMNTDSSVSVSFTGDVRQIKLHHGQVRFSVAKDRVRPFEVNVDDLNVRALGTVFEVSSLNAGESSVIVQEHAVTARLLQAAVSSDQVKVQKGQQLRHQQGLALQQPESISLDQATAWQQRQLVINDQPLSQLIAELNRYRSGRIFVLGTELQSLRVSGVFSLDRPENILDTVQAVLGLQQTRLTDRWIVLHR